MQVFASQKQIDSVLGIKKNTCTSNSYSNYQVDVLKHTSTFDNCQIFLQEISNTKRYFSKPIFLKSIIKENLKGKFSEDIIVSKKIDKVPALFEQRTFQFFKFYNSTKKYNKEFKILCFPQSTFRSNCKNRNQMLWGKRGSDLCGCFRWYREHLKRKIRNAQIDNFTILIALNPPFKEAITKTVFKC